MTEAIETPTLEVRIALSSVAEVREHGDSLFRANVEEVESDMAASLDPDWDVYQAAEETGRLIVLAAWAPDAMVWCDVHRKLMPAPRSMVGYAVAVIHSSAHYRGVTFCQQDLLYVGPQWRNGRVGLRMINRLREEAEGCGAQYLLMHAKPGSRLEALLPRLGFEVEETLFKEKLSCRL